ncbi:hypothetical protein [Cecembia rubra]|uniref:Uncharacterized protein n=1 Tax=Cecembia rubra TaxID=1485585 RepID=A0A2P8E4U0_9BACT|nr:hypothetical protein [Cecembia rubra]PSL04437.1 hypothetical protein CLV48_105181 [Cecembia rubra]
MKFFGTVYYGIIVSILFFGLVMEGYGQSSGGGGGNSGGGGGNSGGGVNCEECSPANNQRNNFVIQEAYLSDSLGVRLTAQQCNSSQPLPEFWITLNYTSRQELNNLKLLFDLFVNNTAGVRIDSLNREYFIGVVQSTGPGQQNSVTIKLELDNQTFNCSNQVLELFNARAFWTANANLNQNGECGGYAPGLCSNPPLVIIPIGVQGFIYDFDFVFDCINEQETNFDVTFFVTTLAGGARPATINWSFEVNGNPLVVNSNGGFSYTIENLSPNDVIKPNLLINNQPSDSLFTIPSNITVPELFEIGHSLTDNDQNISLEPNGSIIIDTIDPDIGDFLFFWTDDDGNSLNPDDPQNLTGLTEGIYNLTMIDQVTGVCRLFEFPITFQMLPIIYKDISIDFINSSRTVSFSWSTAKEWESSHFEIERAVNGASFEKSGEVKATGWSDQLTEYVFEDKILPLTGGTLLYRLKQVDFNGDYHYSEVLAVRVPGIEFTQGVWRAFPNPTDGNELRISLLDANQYSQEPLTLRLIHPTSQTRPITLASESDMNEMLSQMLLKIPKGVFVVEIQWGQKIEHIKVLKQ